MKLLQIAFLTFVILSIILIAGLLGVLIFPDENAGIYMPDIKGPGLADISHSANSEFVDEAAFEEYEKVFSVRDIFQSTVDFANNPAAEQNSGGSSAQGFLTEHYKIVGIIIDQKPQVIFENIVTKDTAFFGVGDKIENAVVKEILPGKVVLVIGNDSVIMSP